MLHLMPYFPTIIEVIGDRKITHIVHTDPKCEPLYKHRLSPLINWQRGLVLEQEIHQNGMYSSPVHTERHMEPLQKNTELETK